MRDSSSSAVNRLSPSRSTVTIIFMSFSFIYAPPPLVFSPDVCFLIYFSIVEE
jgi:hypothetical protein